MSSDPTPDVLVVGAGPIARAAARAARRAGAATVLLDDAGGGTAWGAFAPPGGCHEIAAVINGRSVVLRPRSLVLAPAPVALPHGGLAADTVLARALGAAQRAAGPGLLECVVDFEGRTTVPGVFAVAGTAPLPVSRAAARRAGRAAAAPPRPPGPPVHRRRAAAPVPRPGTLTPAAIVCPCEGVTAADIRRAQFGGARSLLAVKRATRAGMGRCQGRLCSPVLQGFCGGGTEAHAIAPRAPVRPIRISLLMHPEPEPADSPVALPPPNRWTTAARPVRPPAEADAVVIGGGVVGLCAARDLLAAGRHVVVLERGEPGGGASTANAGSLHVQLVPYVWNDGAPGPLAEALPFGPRSIALWRDIAAAAGESLGIRTEGGLALATTEADLRWLGRKAEFERSRGIEVHLVGAAELARIAPHLAQTYAGAAFCPAEGQIDPLRGTMALHRLVRDAGARILSGTPVTALERAGGSWTVHTAGGPIRSRQVLNAAGAHAGVIGRMAGLRLPVGAVVQQVVATAPAPPLLRQLVAQVRAHLSLKQTDAGHVLVGGGWPGRLDPDGATRLLRSSIGGNLHVAVRALPALAGLEAVRAWTGLTVHLDGGPVISETPGAAGLFHAVTTNGYTLGPIAGRLVADAMLGRGAPPAAFALR